jgi:hypothetical protein
MKLCPFNVLRPARGPARLVAAGSRRPAVLGQFAKLRRRRADTAAIEPAFSGSPRLPGKFVWADLVTDDVLVAQRFYTALFGWKFYDYGGYIIREWITMIGLCAGCSSVRAQQGPSGRASMVWVTSRWVSVEQGAAAR